MARLTNEEFDIIAKATWGAFYAKLANGVLVDWRIGELSVDEIAQKHGVPVGAVESVCVGTNRGDLKDCPDRRAVERLSSDYDLMMMRRIYDATLLANKYSAGSGKSPAEAINLAVDAVLLDPVSRVWLADFAAERDVGAIEAKVIISLVCERLFSGHEKRGSHGEVSVSDILDREKIKYIREWNHPSLKSLGLMRFDFYLPEHKSVIEFHGKQHFEPIEYFGGEKAFSGVVKRDEMKKNWCKENGTAYFMIPFNSDVDMEMSIILKKIGIRHGDTR